MPIGPKELKEKTTRQDAADFEEACNKIDNILEKDYNGYGTISIELGKCYNPRVQAMLKEAYRQVGWNRVNFRNIQAHGNYIELFED